MAPGGLCVFQRRLIGARHGCSLRTTIHFTFIVRTLEDVCKFMLSYLQGLLY